MSFEDDINTALQSLNLLTAGEDDITYLKGDYTRDTFESSIYGAMSEMDQMLAGEMLPPAPTKPTTTVKPKKVIGLPAAPVTVVKKVEAPPYRMSETVANNLGNLVLNLSYALDVATDPLNLQRTIRNIEYSLELLEKYTTGGAV